MIDNEYWKRLYKEKFADGVRRAKFIAELIGDWEYEVKPYGFLPESSEYTKESPDEKGKPDFEILVSKDRSVFLETTGTKHSRGADDVWVRPDKFDFAKRHEDLDCWVGHIIEDSHQIRFMKLQNKEKYSIIHPVIGGVTETYCLIPDRSPELIDPDHFEEYLISLK